MQSRISSHTQRNILEDVIFDQAEYQVRCEWGLAGLKALAPVSDVVVIVDILSFTTAVEVAVARRGVILPYLWRDERAPEFAAARNAHLAAHVRAAGYSLSPASLRELPGGYRLVLPSPNGATLAFWAEGTVLLAACLRNAEAVAREASQLGSTVAVIPAGEKWENGELRPSFEDWLGAGAVIHSLAGSRSPEAEMAAECFDRFRERIPEMLRQCTSGKELIARGFAMDVEIAAELNVSHVAPRLTNGEFSSRPPSLPHQDQA